MKTSSTALTGLIALTLLPGCLLHIGDPENRHTRSESVAVTLGPGESRTQRFMVTADEQAAPRLQDLAARAQARSASTGAEHELELRLRNVDTAEEILVDTEWQYAELLLDCGTSGSCTGRYEAVLSRVDTADTTWTGLLDVEGTGRVTCCGDLPGELRIAAE